MVSVKSSGPGHRALAGGSVLFVAHATEALSRASTEELLRELRCRIIAPRDTRHIAWDDWDGPDPQGGWPEQG